MSRIKAFDALDQIKKQSDKLQDTGGYYYLKEHYPVVDAALRAAVNEDTWLTTQQVQYVSDLAIAITLAGDTAHLTSRMRVANLATYINTCR